MKIEQKIAICVQNLVKIANLFAYETRLILEYLEELRLLLSGVKGAW